MRNTILNFNLNAFFFRRISRVHTNLQRKASSGLRGYIKDWEDEQDLWLTHEASLMAFNWPIANKRKSVKSVSKLLVESQPIALWNGLGPKPTGSRSERICHPNDWTAFEISMQGQTRTAINYCTMPMRRNPQNGASSRTHSWTTSLNPCKAAPLRIKQK